VLPQFITSKNPSFRLFEALYRHFNRGKMAGRRGLEVAGWKTKLLVC
jgi:hypothetical protein